ncbi:MAG: FkbM family methyltransferase [Nitrospirota bacterium]
MGFTWLLGKISRMFRYKPLCHLKHHVRPIALAVLGFYLDRVPVNIQGLRMYLSGRDSVLFAWDMLSDSFEVGTTLLIKRLLSKGMTFLDIGSHVGYYSLLASKLIGETGKVYSFEADNCTFEVLVRNIELNNSRNIEAYRVAVSEKTGEVNFYQSNKGSNGVEAFNRIYRGRLHK